MPRSRGALAASESLFRQYVTIMTTPHIFLFKVKDADSLYEAIKKASELSQDEITKMSELSRQKMKNEFDREIVIEKYLTEINS